MKNLYHFLSIPVNNKFKEMQVYFSWCLKPELGFGINLSRSFGNIFSFHIDIFGLFTLNTNWNKEQDHAGFTFYIGLLGLNAEFGYLDNRHWDINNNCWEKYN